MIESRKQILKARLAAPSATGTDGQAYPSGYQTQSSNPTAPKTYVPQANQPLSSVYAQFPSPLNLPRSNSRRESPPRSPSPRSWTGSFSEDDDVIPVGTSIYSTPSRAPSVPQKDTQYVPKLAAPTRTAPRAPPLPPPSSYHYFPSRTDTTVSQSAAARAYTRTKHLHGAPFPPVPRSRPLATLTRSSPCTTYSYPPSESAKGHMNCQGRYLRIGTLRGPKPSEMTWVDGVMNAAQDEASSKKTADKAQKEIERGVKQIRKWLKNENRVTVEYVIDYVGGRYGVNV